MSHFEMFEVRCRLCSSSCIENIISLLTMIKILKSRKEKSLAEGVMQDVER